MTKLDAWPRIPLHFLTGRAVLFSVRCLDSAPLLSSANPCSSHLLCQVIYLKQASVVRHASHLSLSFCGSCSAESWPPLGCETLDMHALKEEGPGSFFESRDLPSWPKAVLLVSEYLFACSLSCSAEGRALPRESKGYCSGLLTRLSHSADLALRHYLPCTLMSRRTARPACEAPKVMHSLSCGTSKFTLAPALHSWLPSSKNKA